MVFLIKSRLISFLYLWLWLIQCFSYHRHKNHNNHLIIVITIIIIIIHQGLEKSNGGNCAGPQQFGLVEKIAFGLHFCCKWWSWRFSINQSWKHCLWTRKMFELGRRRHLSQVLTFVCWECNFDDATEYKLTWLLHQNENFYSIFPIDGPKWAVSGPKDFPKLIFGVSNFDIWQSKGRRPENFYFFPLPKRSSLLGKPSIKKNAYFWADRFRKKVLTPYE